VIKCILFSPWLTEVTPPPSGGTGFASSSLVLVRDGIVEVWIGQGLKNVVLEGNTV
jgi:hypothetical protein